MGTASLPALWIDGHAFGAQVLRGGEEPWRTPDELGFFLRDLAQLLSLDLAELALTPAIRAWSEMQGIALGSLGSRGMDRLLADSAFRAHAKRGLETAQGALGGRPLALALPGPGSLAALCCAEDGIDEDVLDDLALSIADLLRALFRPGLVAFRFDESDPRALEFYAPLLNVARHYEAAAVLVLSGAAVEWEVPVGFDLVFGKNGGGIVLPAAYWEGADLPVSSHSKAFMELPAHAVPETILAKIGQLRGRAV